MENNKNNKIQSEEIYNGLNVEFKFEHIVIKGEISKIEIPEHQTKIMMAYHLN
jgi:hypothetical protein